MPVLKFLFFYEKISQSQKNKNIKNVYKKYLSSSIKSLRQFSFLTCRTKVANGFIYVTRFATLV